MTASGCDRLGPQHRRGRLVGGLLGTRRPPGQDFEGVAVHGGSVGVLSLHEDETDGGRRHR